MDCFEIGMRFSSYESLMTTLDEFCKRTQSKFWKRDARTISASRTAGIQKILNPIIVYYEIKFSCIYGGLEYKPKGKNIRTRHPSLKANGCPAYLRFKASDDGDALQLVASNFNHNHELILPVKKPPKRVRNRSAEGPKPKKSLQILQEMDTVEIEHQDHPLIVEEDHTLIVEEDHPLMVKDHPLIVEDEDYEYDDENNDVEELLDNISEEQDQNTSEHLKVEKNVKVEPDHRLSGLIVPVFTPFHNDEERSLNLDVISEYARFLVEEGVTGVLVHGTTGEGTSLTTEERKVVIEIWAEVCSQTNQHLMVQVGGTCLPDVIELAQHAEEKGANSLLCLPELYHKPQTIDDLIRYLQIVGKAASNTPLFYYHIPSLTNVNIHMGTFLNKIGDNIPTFKGIKFTSTILDEGIAAVKAQDKKFSVFLGADTIMAGAYALGFDSAIATTLNLFPEHGQRILRYVKEGNIAGAQSIQYELNSAIEAITKNGTWVPTMKVAMNLLTTFDLGPTREPLKALTPVEIEEMKKDLTKLGFISS